MVALIAAKIAADLARQGIGVITKKIAEKNAAKVAQFLFPMGKLSYPTIQTVNFEFTPAEKWLMVGLGISAVVWGVALAKLGKFLKE